MSSQHSLTFTSIMRRNDPKLAHNSMGDFILAIDAAKPSWMDAHSRRASFNWKAIAECLVSAMQELADEHDISQISSHDLLTLHEHLNRKFRTVDDSISCSDACQVALDMAIKAHHAPSQEPHVELVA